MFVIFYNDIVDVIDSVKIIKYADDTVIYVADKDINEINSKLSSSMTALGNWFDENELIVNLKKGKTEALLFGTAQRLSKLNEPFSIEYRGEPIQVTTTYKYLGLEIDATLNLNSNFEKSYKRASGRLRLLSRLRCCLDLNCSRILYNTMILPILTYCGILSLKLTSTQSEKLSSLYARAQRLILGDQTNDEISVISPVVANRIRSCHLVSKILNDDICDAFKGYFLIQDHSRNTRNNKNAVVLPSFKTEYARRGFFYMGAKVFNELPLNIRKLYHDKSFKKQLKQFYG